jgi:hypothetical protein
MAEEPGPSRPVPGAAGRARASASGKLPGADGHGQERGIVMALKVAGVLAGWTRIVTIEAVDAISGFLREDGGTGGERSTLRVVLRSLPSIMSPPA